MRHAVSCLRRLQGSLFGTASRSGFIPTSRHLCIDESAGRMSDSIIVTNISGSGGISPIILGLFEYFQRHTPSVGYFLPIAKPKSDRDPYSERLHLIRSEFKLEDDPDSMQGVLESEAEDMLANGQSDELVERIWSKFSEYKRKKGIVIIEGISVSGVSNEIEINGRLAADLGSPVLMVFDAMDDESLTSTEILTKVQIAKKKFMDCHADLVGLVLNRVPKKNVHKLTAEMQELAAREQSCAFAGAIPSDYILQSPRLNEVVTHLKAKWLFGDLEDSDVDASQMMVAAQDVSHLFKKIEHLTEIRRKEGLPSVRPLLLTTPDRTDILLSLAAAHGSSTGPNVSGVLLCDADQTTLDSHVKRIFAAFPHIFPVFAAKTGVYETANRVSHAHTRIIPTSTAKINRSKRLFNEYINTKLIGKRLVLPKSSRITPKQFIHEIHGACRDNKKHIVLPEGQDRRILQAAAEITTKGLADITLLGDPVEIVASARKFNVDISKCAIIDYLNSPLKERFAKLWSEERKEKGATYETSLNLMDDLNVFGTMMVKDGMADGMVSGAMCTTANTIRPALSILKQPEKTLVSSVFLMCLPDTVLVYGDCAINVDPTAEQLAQIAATSAETATSFGVDAKVAMLSYSTLGSGAGPAVEKVKRATEILKKDYPNLKVDGPIQYDAAIDPQVASTKVKEKSDVAGKATVFIFPDLNTGNNTYKAVQQSTGALAIGPLIQGLAKPVNDLSRGCTVADIVNTVACTAIQAMSSSVVMNRFLSRVSTFRLVD
ncbi:hypothetical protein M9435_001162 [Picochlorum sp. BPE23]|nr:hypothetical protein M9435_001162 [Picochlorum sp. BPE23]